MKTLICLPVIFAALLVSAPAEKPEPLQFNTPLEFTVPPGKTKEFSFEGKQGDYWELQEGDRYEFNTFALRAPDGRELLDAQGSDVLPALILPQNGRYVFRTIRSKYESEKEQSAPRTFKATVSNEFTLPEGSRQISTREVNGYVINVYSSNDQKGSWAEILKSGTRLVYLCTGADLLDLGCDASISVIAEDHDKQALLWKTQDKTGDGVPDVAIGRFVLGHPHPGFGYHFYELGDRVIQRPVLSNVDCPIGPDRVNPRGGLFLSTGDASYRGWNNAFEGSPFPSVVLEFKNGDWRPSYSAMKAPAPAPAKLKAMAAKARAAMGNHPYEGQEREFGARFLDRPEPTEPFWGTMLRLIYTGNEKEAWTFFDSVWPKTKPGKEIFRKDFKDRLEGSAYWGAILKERGSRAPKK